MILLALILRAGDGNLTDGGFVIVFLGFEVLVVAFGVVSGKVMISDWFGAKC